MMPRACPAVFALIATALVAALALGACGSEGIEVAEEDPLHEGAVLFAERCGGCHIAEGRRGCRLGQPRRCATRART